MNFIVGIQAQINDHQKGYNPSPRINTQAVLIMM
jgi:hypothetical protein